VLDAEGMPKNTIIHCFSGGPVEAQECLDRGAYLSFSGIVTFKTANDLENGNFDLEVFNKTIVFIDSDCNRFMLTKKILQKALPDIIIFDNSEWFINSSKEIISKDYNEFIFWGVRPESFMDKATSVFIKRTANTLQRNYDYVSPNGSGLPADNYPEDIEKIN
jgi:hypothetical protein